MAPNRSSFSRVPSPSCGVSRVQGTAATRAPASTRPTNPKQFNRSMRKPSMRFARAGSTVRESAAAFISGGSGTGEGGAGDGEIECSGIL